ncbi:MAG: GlnB, partial [Deltaproteobacteria bacterium HGW-Deltaproteobacteria-12]
MKEIKAIIRPLKLWDVVEELKGIEGLPGVTVSEIRGFGK